MIPNQGIPGRRHERAQPREKFYRRHDAVGASLAWLLEEVGDSAVGQDRDALERKRRAGAITQQPFATFVVLGFDAHGAVNVEAIARR
jgi:hypothetical protein